LLPLRRYQSSHFCFMYLHYLISLIATIEICICSVLIAVPFYYLHAENTFLTLDNRSELMVHTSFTLSKHLWKWEKYI